MADTDKLLVLPNPYGHLDARGRPSAAFPYEGMSGRDRYVGAQVDAARTKKLGRVVFVPAGYAPEKGAGEAHLMAAWAAVTAVEVADTLYYRRALRHGDLLPGDERTRDLVGLPKDAPAGAAALEAARRDASARYRAAHDKAPAFELACAAKKDDAEKKTTEGGAPAPADNTPGDGAKETP